MIPAARPPTHFIYSLLRTYIRFENTAIAQTDLLESQTRRDFAEMRRIESEKQVKFLELAKTIKSEKNWGIVSFASQTAISVSALAFGAASLTNENTRSSGVLMLASGVANVASRVFSYAGTFKKVASWMTQSNEMQEKIASRMEVGTQCVAAGLGALGAFSAYRNGTMTESMSKVKSWIASPSAVLFSKGFELKKSLFERQSKHISAFLMQSESLIMQIFHRIHQTSKDGERLVHTIGDICEALKQAISSLYTRN